MKKSLLILVLVLFGITQLIAQAPQAFNYQAIARDKAGNILSNHQVSIKIGILQGDIDGPAVYQETHTATTNDFGLINLSIGEGQRTTDGGSDELEGLSVVDWSQGAYFIKVEMDENGGSNYREMGTAELLSVPYALYAESSGDRNREADDDWGINGNHVYTGIASDPSCQSGNAGIGDSNPNAKLSVVMQDGFNSMFKRINSAPTSNALFLLRRARGTIGSETAVVNGDYIGQIGFEAFTGTQYKRAAGIFTQVDGAVTSTIIPGNIHFKTRDEAGVMNEHMRISSNGKVGIGTVDPNFRKFSIDGGDLVGLHVLNNHAYFATISAINEGSGPVGYYYGGDFIILGGNVGIDNDTPGYPLDVVGIVNANNYYKNGSEFNEGKWSVNGNKIYYNSGNVGIGTSNPGVNLDVIATGISWVRAKSLTSFAGLIIDKGDALDNGYTIYRTAGIDKWFAGLIGDDNFSISKTCSPTDGTFYISSAKNVGIGTTNPTTKLRVHGGSGKAVWITNDATGGINGVTLFAENYSTSGGIAGWFNTNGTDATVVLEQDGSGALLKGFGPNGGNEEVRIDKDGTMHFYNAGHTKTIMIDPEESTAPDGGQITLYNASGVATIEIDGDYNDDGRITTQELQITGGSDIAEPFDIISEDEILPGMVLSIDKDHPGKLIVSDNAYDRCVAGVISGAGDIETGLVLKQKNSIADGEYLVALTGRVYCLADATYGSIKPGDLLTTSNTPGHAMKVTDHTVSHGTIIGKAMTALEDGKGLVFILVTLQ